ncbi:hypothetical protein ABK040_002889 [Willaertia magna]
MLKTIFSSSPKVLHQQQTNVSSSIWVLMNKYSSKCNYHTNTNNNEVTSPAKYHINTNVIKPNKYKFPLIKPEKINQMAIEKAISSNVATGTKVIMDSSKTVVPKFEIQPEALVKNLQTGEFVEHINLHPYFFNCTPRKDILYEVVKWQLAKRRQGTHKTKHRLEVAFSKKKLTNQKGRGASRHSDKGAPIFKGGGHAMAIRPRSYYYKLNKKIRRLALRMALTTKYLQGKLVIVDDLKIEAPKTKIAAKAIANTIFSDVDVKEKEIKDRGVLIIDGEEVNPDLERATFNLHYVDYLCVRGLNVYDMLRREKLVLSKQALERLYSRYEKHIKEEYY